MQGLAASIDGLNAFALQLYSETHSIVQGLLGVVALLAEPEYREAVLEGLIASIGGLDASLSKEASAALVSTLHAPPCGEQAYTSDPMIK